MRLRHIQFLLVLPVLFLAACVSPPPPPEALDVAARDKISSTDVVLPIKQSEIYVFVPNSNVAAATGGGLLGALIDVTVDSVRTSHAETAVKALRDAIVDYNFDDALQNEVKTSLSGIAWVGVGDVHVVRDVTDGSLDSALAGSKAGAVLFTTTDYHLDNDGNLLTVTANVCLYPNNDALRAMIKNGKPSPKTARENAIYRNLLTFETKVPGAGTDRDKNMATWSADKGAAMRAALSLSAKELATMLAADLQGQEAAGSGGAVKIDAVDGQIVVRDENGTVVRLKDGSLKFATKSVL